MNTSEPNQSNSNKTQNRRSKPINLIHWIGLIDRLEAAARYIFLGMAALSFAAYGYMVHTQDQWQNNHRQLQKLRNQETQQAIINARLRSQAAELAEKAESGMINPDPSRAVFMPIDSQPAKSISKSTSSVVPPEISAPVGY
jgi:hypothetical protein